MFLADYHTHSVCSMDGEFPLSAIAESAAAAGLSELCVTDHCDLLSPEGTLMPDYDWTPALTQFEKTAPCAPLSLRLGLELGNANACPERARAIVNRAELDFIIGSLHNHTVAAGGTDLYYEDYRSADFCYAVLDDYFTAMEELVPLSDCYDVLGHIIYPLRYMCLRDGQVVTLDRYADRLSAILRTAISLGRGIEVNTWCGRTVENWRELLTTYRTLGGEIVTAGSDAHAPKNVGKGIANAYELLRSVGFRYVCVYRHRKPEFVAL